MKFSIIVPVYNAESRIEKCLDSIINQTFSDFEVILINDGSTDNTLSTLKDYCQKDSRFHVYSFDNSGVGLSRRRGITLAQGDYLIFVDSDDTINPELLSSLKPFTENNKMDVIRYQCSIIYDKDFKDHSRYNITSDYIPKTGIEALHSWSIPGKKYAVYWLFCFKREILLNSFLIPNLRCYEDVAIIPLLIISAKSVITIDYVGYHYIQNKESLTNVRSISSERSRAYDFIAAYDYFINNIIKCDIDASDCAFFINDYNHRLLLKFNSLPDNLKKELILEFSKRIPL